MITPRLALRTAAALGGSALAMALLAVVSATPLRFHGSDSGQLRLSWTARPERIEVCRTLSKEELESRPEHMRRRVECDGKFATYTLRVQVDDRTVGEAVIHGAGLRHDRPIFLLREFPVPPGAHRMRVSFTRREQVEHQEEEATRPAVPEADTGLYAGRAEREVAERARRAHAAIPSRLELDTSVTLVPRGVALVTFNAERKMFELHLGPGRHP